MPRRPARPAAEPATALLAAPVKAGGLEEVGATVPTGVTGATLVGAGPVELTKMGATGEAVGLKLTVHGQLVIVIVSEAVAV